MVADKDFEPFSFWKGAQDVLKNKDGTTLDATEAIEKIRGQLGDALNARNLSFLFGSGCSSFRVDGSEVGIPTMGPMAKSFLGTVGVDDGAPCRQKAVRTRGSRPSQSGPQLSLRAMT